MDNTFQMIKNDIKDYGELGKWDIRTLTSNIKIFIFSSPCPDIFYITRVKDHEEFDDIQLKIIKKIKPLEIENINYNLYSMNCYQGIFIPSSIQDLYNIKIRNEQFSLIKNDYFNRTFKELKRKTFLELMLIWEEEKKQIEDNKCFNDKLKKSLQMMKYDIKNYIYRDYSRNNINE